MDPTEVFLRGVWKMVPSEDDLSWVERVAALARTEEPLGDHGPIVKDMLDKGVDPYSIARFAKIVGYETAFGICYHLDDPIASYEGFPDGDEDLVWGLFQVDSVTEEPRERLNGTHETILLMDPSGREMRPRNG